MKTKYKTKYKVTHPKDNSVGYWTITDSIEDWVYFEFYNTDWTFRDFTMIKRKHVDTIIMEARREGLTVEELHEQAVSH